MNEWQVMTVEGHERDLRAFVAGCLVGREAEPVTFGDDVGLARESLHERLRALLKGGHHAVIAPAATVTTLSDALQARGAGLGLRVSDRHPVDRASFDLSCEIFSREIAAAVRRTLDGAAPGVEVRRSAEAETSQPEAEGVELYAPLHDYSYRLEAAVSGPIAATIALRKALSAFEVVRLGALHLA